MKNPKLFLLSILALLSSAGSAEERCTGTPTHYVWKQTSLKADANKSALALAHDASGTATGYEIADMSGHVGALFKSMTLQKGDILVAVDGVEIDSPFLAVPRFASAKPKQTFCLTYLRGGERLVKPFQRDAKR